MQLLLPGGDTIHLPGGDIHLPGGDRHLPGRPAPGHLTAASAAAATTTTTAATTTTPSFAPPKKAHAPGRRGGTPGRSRTPARGDNRRKGGHSAPAPVIGGGGRGRRPAGRGSARAKLRPVASAAARRDAAANATRGITRGAAGGGGGAHAPRAGGRKGLLLPARGRERRHVDQARQHRLGSAWGYPHESREHGTGHA